MKPGEIQILKTSGKSISSKSISWVLINVSLGLIWLTIRVVVCIVKATRQPNLIRYQGLFMIKALKKTFRIALTLPKSTLVEEGVEHFV